MGAKKFPESKPSSLELFRSTPGNIHNLETDKLTQNRSTLHLSVTKILAYSAQNIDGSDILLEPTSDLSVSNSDSDLSKQKKTTSFNWKLIYQPQCLAVGLAMFAYVSGISLVYNCIPPLGKQSGRSADIRILMLYQIIRLFFILSIDRRPKVIFHHPVHLSLS